MCLLYKRRQRYPRFCAAADVKTTLYTRFCIISALAEKKDRKTDSRDIFYSYRVLLYRRRDGIVHIAPRTSAVVV